jgi:hypothetical protein
MPSPVIFASRQCKSAIEFRSIKLAGFWFVQIANSSTAIYQPIAMAELGRVGRSNKSASNVELGHLLFYGNQMIRIT